MDLPFYVSNYENSSTGDYLFGVVGKIIMISQRFERYVKSLEALLNLKSNSLDYDQQMQQTAEKIFRKTLNNNMKDIKTIINSNSIIIDVFLEKLKKAREARNYFAHECSLKLDATNNSVFEDIDKLDELLDDYKSKVNDILVAEQIVVVVIALMTHEDYTPNKDILDHVIEWIFDDKKR